ncbi:MAG: bifunctional phosphoribosyl-AMP cyclohydrolase/phosphoribosyl-ATP diphosphatase HisIE [Thermoanaerobaculia bacterium]|nr:bifunctional phosphoribosyl-AMP cyclohydrolase/phosphoribosyl-ATP diphosphatase HisIE [Thermoanaerobaculia bacterium]
MSAESSLAEFDPAVLRYDAAGLLPVVAQDAFSGRVLMLAWANADAVAMTLATGEAHFWSRSRRALWRKGETSGNVLRLVSIERDCDGDSLLLRVIPAGPACHTGATSCFDADFSAGEVGAGLDLGALERIIAARASADPEASYTARLFAEGIERMAQKVGEEATEVVIAALASHHARDPEGERTGKGEALHPADSLPSRTQLPAPEARGSGREQKQRLVEEASDLLFHLLVLLRANGVTTLDLARELSARHQGRASPAVDNSLPLPRSSAASATTQAERREPPRPGSSEKKAR